MTALIISLIVIIIAAIYIFLTAPALKKRDMTAFSNVPVAHRGLYNNIDIPENSIPGFIGAAENRYGIELDVHLCADGTLAVFHDDTLTRMCGADVCPESLAFAELSQYRLSETNECIPSFEQVLTVLNNSPVPLIVELKSTSTKVAELCDRTVSALSDYSGSYCIESFNPIALSYLRKHHPSVIRGLLADAFMRDRRFRGSIKYFALHHMLLNFTCRPQFIAYNFRSADTFAMFLCRRLYRVPTAAWTVRTPDEFAGCAEYNIKICENFLKAKPQ